MADRAFGDLRRLADTLGGVGSGSLRDVETVARRLGRTAVPLLGRELRGASVSDPARRDLVRRAFAAVAKASDESRERVVGELRAIAAEPGAADDDAKVTALRLLHDLGERVAARFRDPSAIQRQSASALATQLGTAADVAIAADLMLREMPERDAIELLEVMAAASPSAAALLAGELAIRLDAPVALRERSAALADSAAAHVEPSTAARRPARPLFAAVLVDARARLCVVASRKQLGERRWRQWAVLVGASGQIDQCLHVDDACEPDAAPLVAELVADGYRVASHDAARAAAIVTSAARLTGSDRRRGAALTSAYYLGRDLLEIGDAHATSRSHAAASPVGRAVELLAGGEPARAYAVLARAEGPDADASAAACLLALGRPADALVPLARALDAEPEWPLHHWNHAAALHALGDAAGSRAALRSFVATSARPSGLDADAEQPVRLALAARLLADAERASRLADGSADHAVAHANANATSTST